VDRYLHVLSLERILMITLEVARNIIASAKANEIRRSMNIALVD
jgi:hypothetical protein